MNIRRPPSHTKTALTTDSDLVRVARFYALQALERIAAPGAVAVEPVPAAPAVLFLVPPGSSGEWDVPRTIALAEGSLVLPLDERQSPPGAYWLIPPGHGRLHTDVHHLRRALEAVFSLPARRSRVPEVIAPSSRGVLLGIPTTPRRPRTRSRGMANASTRKSVEMPELTAGTPAPDTDSLPLDPLDFTTMVKTARRVAGSDAQLSGEDLQTAVLQLRGHLALLIPEAEDRLGRLAPVGIEEARRRLDADPGVLGPVRYAHCLARSVLMLCTHLGHGSEDSGTTVLRSSSEPWAPPTGTTVELVAAGRYWDAVRVRTDVGERVIKRLGGNSGAVIQDSYGAALYWLVAPGTTDAWDLPAEQVVPLGVATFLAVPPAHFTDTSRRIRWAVPLTAERYLTHAELLHDALAAEISATA
ncbi:DUF6415 family natural product biosynthesis protein [Streptomyces sp. NPDC059479]|uniref:DUF6415 family natural product biosynthesis protein n=1 Tax=Streptomyces sp. NPDC059479 TaxID=3346848 RepID=UPI0036B94FA9